MLTKPVFALAAALNTASAAVLPARQIVAPEQGPATDGVPAGTFSITSFSVAQEPYGLYTTYNLVVTDPANPSTAPSNTSTSCRTTTETTPAITGFVNLTCNDPSVKWSFVENGTSYNLEVKHNWGETVQHAIVTAYDNVTDTARAFFPSSDVKQNPNVEGIDCPYLDAPTAFNLSYSRYIL